MHHKDWIACVFSTWCCMKKVRLKPQNIETFFLLICCAACCLLHSAWKFEINLICSNKGNLSNLSCSDYNWTLQQTNKWQTSSRTNHRARLQNSGPNANLFSFFFFYKTSKPSVSNWMNMTGKCLYICLNLQQTHYTTHQVSVGQKVSISVFYVTPCDKKPKGRFLHTVTTDAGKKNKKKSQGLKARVHKYTNNAYRLIRAQCLNGSCGCLAAIPPKIPFKYCHWST